MQTLAHTNKNENILVLLHPAIYVKYAPKCCVCLDLIVFAKKQKKMMQ
jgi:hypothetical protein